MIKIAIQGVAGAFHDEAAQKFFGSAIQLIECSSFPMLCKHVQQGTADFAVMAIENTIAGSLLQNYGYLDQYNLHVFGEVYLHICMNLMALPGTKINDLLSIASHPIALRQCGDFLAGLPEHIQIFEADDTAESAKIIACNQKQNTAAIAGVAAAKLYKLEILQAGIETEKENYTRFLVVANSKQMVKEANKATLSFKVSHTAGSLVEILTLFAAHQINLTKIQSVPILGKPYQYAFHVDVEWNEIANFDLALKVITAKVEEITLYGMYKKGNLKTDIHQKN